MCVPPLCPMSKSCRLSAHGSKAGVGFGEIFSLIPITELGIYFFPGQTPRSSRPGSSCCHGNGMQYALFWAFHFCSHLEAVLQLSATCPCTQCWCADLAPGCSLPYCLWTGILSFLFQAPRQYFHSTSSSLLPNKRQIFCFLPYILFSYMFCKLLRQAYLEICYFFISKDLISFLIFISPLIKTSPDLHSHLYQSNFVSSHHLKAHQVQFKVGNPWKFILRIYLRMGHE